MTPPARSCSLAAMIKGFLLDIERLDYASALDLMRGLAGARQSGLVPEVLILLEHDPVVTLGRRGGVDDLLVSEDRLRSQGIAVHRVERGGQATYHGPGQLVAYPVCRLKSLGLGVSDFAHKLEEAALAALAHVGVQAGTRPDHPGVWVDGRKVASLGLAVRRGVTIHGLALNVDPDLDHFGLISPCGLGPGVITSLARLLDRPVDPNELRRAFAQSFARIFQVELIPWTLEQAREMARRALAPDASASGMDKAPMTKA